MIFIPLIENTFKHSNKNVSKPGINIEFSINNSHIQLKTSNFIKFIQKDNPNKKGMGLNNLNKRLELLYGEKHDLTIKEDSNIFQVELNIPL